MGALGNSEISRLKKMKGRYRIWKPNTTSTFLLEIDYNKFPGIYHRFLESRNWTTENGEWIEHKLLLRTIKNRHSFDCLGIVLKSLGELIKSLKNVNFEGFDGVNLEEIDDSDPLDYYFLLSIISDGKDYEEKV